VKLAFLAQSALGARNSKRLSVAFLGHLALHYEQSA
jgi:hypothetical protein